MSSPSSSKSLNLYSTIFEATPEFSDELLSSENFLSSKSDSLREMDFSSDEEESSLCCSNNPYLFKESAVLTDVQALRDKILELC